MYVLFSGQNFHSGTKSFYYQYSCISKTSQFGDDKAQISGGGGGGGGQNQNCPLLKR